MTTEIEVMAIRADDELMTETWKPLGEGPLAFAMSQDRELRRLMRQADWPTVVTVLSTRRVPDEPTDRELVLAIGEHTHSIQLHCESIVRIATR